MRFPEDVLNALLRELWECAADFYENGRGADPEARYAAGLLDQFAPDYKGPRSRAEIDGRGEGGTAR